MTSAGTVLVTGGASGLGAAVVAAVVRAAGGTPVVLDRPPPEDGASTSSSTSPTARPPRRPRCRVARGATAGWTPSSPRPGSTCCGRWPTCRPTTGSGSSRSTCSAPPRSCGPRCRTWSASRGAVVTVASTLGLRAVCATPPPTAPASSASSASPGRWPPSCKGRVEVTLLVPGGMHDVVLRRPHRAVQAPGRTPSSTDPSDVAGRRAVRPRPAARLRGPRAGGDRVRRSRRGRDRALTRRAGRPAGARARRPAHRGAGLCGRSRGPSRRTGGCWPRRPPLRAARRTDRRRRRAASRRPAGRTRRAGARRRRRRGEPARPRAREPPRCCRPRPAAAGRLRTLDRRRRPGVAGRRARGGALVPAAGRDGRRRPTPPDLDLRRARREPPPAPPGRPSCTRARPARPGAGRPSGSRRWPATERTAGHHVVVTGGAGEAASAAAVAARGRAAGRRAVLAGRTGPGRLAALVAAAPAGGLRRHRRRAPRHGARHPVGRAVRADVAGAVGAAARPARHRALWAGRAGDPHGERLDPGLSGSPSARSSRPWPNCLRVTRRRTG